MEFKFKALHLSPTSGDRQQCKPWNYGPNKTFISTCQQCIICIGVAQWLICPLHNTIIFCPISWCEQWACYPGVHHRRRRLLENLPQVLQVSWRSENTHTLIHSYHIHCYNFTIKLWEEAKMYPCPNVLLKHRPACDTVFTRAATPTHFDRLSELMIFCAVLGYFLCAICVFIIFLLIGSTVCSNWWLSYWLESGSGNVRVPNILFVLVLLWILFSFFIG